LAETEAFFFFCSIFCFFSSFLSSGFFMFSRDLVSSCLPVIFPGHQPWMSSPPWVDMFLTSHASIIYSLALLIEIHFPVLDKCMKLVFSSYYVWKQSNISTWSIAWSGNSSTRIRNEYHHFLFLYLLFVF
jgi:hypothetical protein